MTTLTADLSFAEEALWLAEHDDPRTTPFVDCAASLSAVARLHGPLDHPALQAALEALVNRHDVLRSRFVAHDGRPARVVDDAPAATLTHADLRADARGGDQDEPLTRAQALVSGDMTRPFDLARGPLLRPTSIALGHDDHVLAITVHHIAFDRWSKRVLARELGELYEAHATGRAPRLPPLKMQYADYVSWQRQRLESPLARALVDRWTTALRDAPDLTLPTLPGGAGAARVLTARPASCWFTIPAADGLRLAEMSRKSRVTLANVVLAILTLCLHRVSGADDLTIGVPVSDRRRPEFEDMIGLFTNVVAVRMAIAPGMSFLDLLNHARDALVGAARMQDMPYGYLVNVLGPGRPLFRVLFNFMPGIAESEMGLPGLRAEPVPVATEPRSLADLSLHVRQEAGALACRLVYKADVFPPDGMQEIAARFQALVTGVLDDPRRGVETY